MVSIIGWKVDGEKIFLKMIYEGLNGGEETLLELPNDIYKEILRDGPPNEAKMIRDLIEKIHNVRIERVLTVEEVDKQLSAIGVKEEKASEALEKAVDKLQVDKWSAILRSLAGRRSNQSQRRHLVKLLHQEEGALSKELMTKL
jgi:hypothetical protein